MKNLSNRVLTIASLCAFLSQTVQAQDTYWSMAGNIVYNTKTGIATMQSNTAAPLDYPAVNPKAVFDVAGNVLFSTGESVAMYNHTAISTFGSRTVIPLPGVSGCARRYALINASPLSPGSSSMLEINVVDVTSGSPAPTTGGGTITTGGDPIYYDVVAAPVQGNGDHYYYFISANNGPGQPGPYIEQYTLHADGSRPTTVNSYGTTANYRAYFANTTHFAKSKVKISNDGAYIAYQDINGDMVTFNTATQTYAMGPHMNQIYGLAGINVNGTVRWYTSTATQFGTFNQGSTTYTAAILGTGIYSEIAQGADGQVYVARGNSAVAPATDLLSFDPYIGGVTFTKRADNCVYYNGTQYTFGNQIDGENTSELSSIHTDFTVNGGRGTLITPKALYTCTDFYLYDMTAPIYASSLNLEIVQVDANGNQVVGGLYYSNVIANTGLASYNLKNLPGTNGTWLGTAGHDGIYRITTYNYDACRRVSSHTEFVKVISSSVLLDFSVQGPPAAGCPNGGAQGRNSTGVFAAYGQVSAPFCSLGWLGAASCGILGVNPTFAGISNPSLATYTVTIDDVNANTQIATQDFTSTQLPASLPFSSLASGYFISNYATIKGTGTFKVSASVTTPECGKITVSSFFKIINGGSTGNYWRETGMPEVVEANVFPNPATSQIHVAWTTPSGTIDAKASVMIVDVLGRVVINKELAQAEGSNDVLLDVSMLAPGTYHYKLATASGDKTGTVVKQ